jgi:hypothetical protein
MRAVSSVLFLVFVAACGASNAAPSSSAQGGAANADACTTDADCVPVKGDPCNRCGACPGDPTNVMSATHLQAIQNDPECSARLGPKPVPGQPPPPPPNCSPCPSGTAEDVVAACIANRCTKR